MTRVLKEIMFALEIFKNATSVMKQLPPWFDEYNENALHKGLKRTSPEQY